MGLRSAADILMIVVLSVLAIVIGFVANEISSGRLVWVAEDQTLAKRSESSRKWRTASRAFRDMSDLFCANATPPKVAWCLSGQIRTMPFPLVHYSQLHYGIESFGGDYKIFMYLQAGNNELYPEMKAPNLTHDYAMALETVLKYDPTSYVLQQEAVEAPVNPNCTFDPQRTWLGGHPNRPRRLAAQYQNVKNCYRLVTEYEKANNMRFDWVIRMRPDVTIAKSLHPWCLWENNRIYASPWQHLDHFVMTPRKFSDYFFNVIDYYYNCSEGVPRLHDPEAFVRYAAERAGSRLDQRPLYVTLTRAPNDWGRLMAPLCHALEDPNCPISTLELCANHVTNNFYNFNLSHHPEDHMFL
eukprot:TRINITY_DN19579_c0_g1_i1.p1 TRINITY_DN19579_c0_g1~~TRINITY_DN19579_c0_g1_i1.p1  ORF type:complete len:356 (+),score=30.32 TRINITY_DN19579_c0_g1_i1:151-1218(+)